MRGIAVVIWADHGSLKVKLEPVTGIPAQSQVLSLCRSENDPQLIRQIDDDAKPLGFYSLENWMLIKVSL